MLLGTLRINTSAGEKHEVVQAFYELIEFSFENPMMREMYLPDKEIWIIGREIPRILRRSLERYL
jgi:hypothetical protein